MSYDFNLRDPVTRKVLKVPGHLMHGGNIPCQMIDGVLVPIASTEAYINITYNYSEYYYEALDEEEATENGWGVMGGARSICGLTGAQAIPVLELMIRRIEERYRNPDGTWKEKHVEKVICTDTETGQDVPPNIVGLEISAALHDGGPDETEALARIDGKYDIVKESYVISEGSTSDYWEATAANAILGLDRLLAMSRLRPDGIWTEDS